MNVYKQSTRTERQMVTQSQDLFYTQLETDGDFLRKLGEVYFLRQMDNYG